MNEYPIIYDGNANRLWGLWFKKIILSLLTMGIYSFWGKTNLRKYVAHSFHINNERFEYIGTGKELFLGFLRALPFIILLFLGGYGVFLWTMSHFPTLIPFLLIINYGIGFFILIFAYYSAFSYRISRLTWQGIRGHMEGPIASLVLTYMGRFFLNCLTLGILIPHSDLRLTQKIYGQLFYGSVRYHFTMPQNHNLMRTHIITGLLVPFTLGFSRFWYQAKLTRCICDHLNLAQLTIKTTVTGKNLCKLHFLNFLIFICTLGLGVPWMIQRDLTFFATHFKVCGDVSQMTIFQAHGEFKQTGEGLETIIGDGSFLG